MRLLLSFATVILIVWSTVQAVQNRKVSMSFESAAIVPYVIPRAPEDILEVSYDAVSPCLGEEVRPYEVIELPDLEYRYRPGVNYTLIFIDPDVPSAASPALGSVVLWLVVNIPGDSIEDGCVIADYIPPSPYPGSGYHRYIYLVYAQNTTIDTTDRSLLRLGINRVKFCVADFVEQYDLGALIAGNYFVSYIPAVEYQPYCNNSQADNWIAL